MSSFRKFLTREETLVEGTIKLPTSMYRAGMAKIMEEVCNFIIGSVAGSGTGPLGTAVEKYCRQKLREYGSKTVPVKKKTISRFSLEIDETDLPPAYRKVIKDNGGMRTQKLAVNLDWVKSTRLKNMNGYLWDRTEGKGIPLMVLGVSRIVNMPWTALRHKSDKLTIESTVAELDEKLQDLEGTFEHELTHYVQYMILALASVHQVNSYGDYNLKAVEFDPQVKSEVRMFLRQAKSNEQIGWTKNDRRFWISVFLGAAGIQPKKSILGDVISPAGMVFPSRFFQDLKKHDMDKWKKACKLFTTLIEDTKVN